MRNSHIAHAIAFVVLLTTAIQAAPSVGSATYDVRIDTSSLVGHPAGPFYLFLAVTDGSGLSDGNNAITISNISFADGTTLGNPSSFGGVVGELGSTLNMTDTATLNFFSEPFSAGQSLTFKITATNNVDDGPVPDGFALYILDNSGRPIPTLSPGSDYLIGLPMGVTGVPPAVFGGDPSRLPSVGTPISIAAPMVTLEDTVPPVTVAQLSPQPNTAGWNNTDVTVVLTSTDSEASGTGVKQITYSASGAQPIASTIVPGAMTSFTINTEGMTTITFFGADSAGNIETAKTLTIQIDKTPPTISGSRMPGPNLNGWNNSGVTVSFQCVDSLSGLAAGSPAVPTTLAFEGAGQVVNGTCMDLAGNTASASVQGINIDLTPPTISCGASPELLWPPNHKLVPINVSVTVSDSLSGPAGFTLNSVTSDEPDSGQGDIQGFVVGTASTNGRLRAERLGSGDGRVYTFAYTGMDRAGNSTTCNTNVSVPHDQGH